MKTTIVTAVMSLVLSACGGGGSGSGSSSGISSDANGGFCSQEYYQTIIGSYTGEVMINDQNTNAPRVCSWQLSVDIFGAPIDNINACILSATTSGTVTQSTFFPDDIVNRYQCIDDRGNRSVREPNGQSAVLVDDAILDNSLFPVDIDFSRISAPTRGPNFGDESVSANYVYLFDTTLRDIVQQVTLAGDGSMVLRDTNGLLLGRLIKEQGVE